MKTIVAAVALALAFSACGRTRDSSLFSDGEDREGGASGSRGGREGSGGTRAAGGAPPAAGGTAVQGGTDAGPGSVDGGVAGAPPGDGAPDVITCDSVSSGRLTGFSLFETDAYTSSPSPVRAGHEPFGLVACGDALCLMGRLGSRVHFERDLVARGTEDVYLARVTRTGEALWSTRLGGSTPADRYVGGGIAADSRGNVVVSGACSEGELLLPGRVVPCPVDGSLSLLARFDPDARLLWVREVGPTAEFGTALPVAAHPDGRIVVSARLGNSIGLPETARPRTVVISFDPDGTEVFRRYFDGDEVSPGGLAMDSEGNVVLTGEFVGTVTTSMIADAGADTLDTAGSGICAVKLGASGALVWSRCFEGTRHSTWGPVVAIAPDGSVVLAGTLRETIDFGAIGNGAPKTPSRLSTNFEADIFLARLSGAGDFVWQRLVHSSYPQSAGFGVSVTPEGVILLPGVTEGELDVDGHQIVARQDASSPFVAGFDLGGRALFARQIGTSADAWGAHSIVASDCRTFFLASDYRGDLLAPGAPADGLRGIVILGGRY